MSKGFAHLLLIVFIAIGLILALTYFIFTKKTLIVKQKTTAPIASYQNPLDKKSQYINPFSESENPFDSLK